MEFGSHKEKLGDSHKSVSLISCVSFFRLLCGLGCTKTAAHCTLHISEEVGLHNNSCTLHSEEVGVQCDVMGLRPLAPEQLMMGIEQIKVNQTLQFIAASTKLVMSLQHCEQERL